VVQDEGGERVLTGEPLHIAPDYIINWGGRFKPRTDMDAIVEVKHVDTTYGEPCVESSCTAANTIRLDGYTIVDASLSWFWKAFRVTLAAHNLLDSEYYSNAGKASADPGRPRQILLSTSVRVK
jgi:outer membrane receptor protein involved in Fe transport